MSRPQDQDAFLTLRFRSDDNSIYIGAYEVRLFNDRVHFSYRHFNHVDLNDDWVDPTEANILYDPVNFSYWQLRANDNIVYFEVSSDAETWVTMGMDVLDEMDSSRMTTIQTGKVEILVNNKTEDPVVGIVDSYNSSESCN